MHIDLMGIRPTWLRRVVMVPTIPVLVVLTLILQPLWEALKMLRELLGSCLELPHSIGQIWAGRRCRYERWGPFTYAGEPYAA